MMKVRCGCGALLSVEPGQARFRCPQCQRILKLPSGPESGLESGLESGEAADLPPGMERERQQAPPVTAGRAALVSRLQMGLLGALLLGLIAPIRADRAVLDSLLAALGNAQQLDLLGLARLWMPICAALALIAALAPLRSARGLLVGASGGALMVLTFGHLAAHPESLRDSLRLCQLVPPAQLLGYGFCATLLCIVMLAAAQTRAHSAETAFARTTSCIAGFVFCALVAAFLASQRQLLNQQTMRLALGSHQFLLYQTDSPRLLRWLPELYAGSIGGMALLGLLSLFGRSRRRWLVWLTGIVGALSFALLPLGVIALAQPTDLAGARRLTYQLATLYAPILLCLAGLRDYMAAQIQTPDA